ncbi:MAG TPA: metallophosphoesterase, partial [Archangium sp.]|nr:metallophosphoesterase [Archangium sp.]
RHHKALMEAARRHSGLPPPGPVLRPPPGANIPHTAIPLGLPVVNAPPLLLKQAAGDEEHHHAAPVEGEPVPLSTVTDLDG